MSQEGCLVELDLIGPLSLHLLLEGCRYLLGLLLFHLDQLEQVVELVQVVVDLMVG